MDEQEDTSKDVGPGVSNTGPQTRPHSALNRSGGYRGNFKGRIGRRQSSRAPEQVDIFSSIPNVERLFTAYPQDNLTTDFRVVSFNVLADYLAMSPDGNLAHNHPSQAWRFKWSFRCTRLLREILTWHAGVVCLQEVDHFSDFFEPQLRKYGYIGYHKRRTGVDTHDGCSIFVKKDVFDVDQVVEVNFKTPQHPILNRDNIALVLALTHKPSNEKVVISNTHILFNPRRGDVKLAQIQMLLDTVKELGIPNAIICGDFNLTPKSALYDFLSRGTLDGVSEPVGDASGQFAKGHSNFHNDFHTDEIERHQGAGTAAYRFSSSDESRKKKRTVYRGYYSNEMLGKVVTHDLPLRSAYAQHPTAETSGEPFATTYHDRFLGTVDYIWHMNIECTGVVEMPNMTFFKGARALPTRDLSSDHLSLVADFSFRRNQ